MSFMFRYIFLACENNNKHFFANLATELQKGQYDLKKSVKK